MELVILAAWLKVTDVIGVPDEPIFAARVIAPVLAALDAVRETVEPATA